MNTMDKIEEELCDALGQYARDGIKSPADVHVVKQILSAISKIKIIEGMEKYDADSETIHKMATETAYVAPYTIRQKLEHLMGEATNDKERVAIREAINKI